MWFHAIDVCILYSSPIQLEIESSNEQPDEDCLISMDHQEELGLLSALSDCSLTPGFKATTSENLVAGTLSTRLDSLIMMVLSHSPLLEKAAEILTSGSVEEMARYFNLCRGVMDFVLALESHPGLATLAYHNRHIYHKIGGDLYTLSFRDAPSKLRLEVKDTRKSFVNMLGSLAVQAESIRKNYVATGDFATGEGGCVISEAANLLFLCDNIIQIQLGVTLCE
ncbi:hypothetical protein HD806DRAFT_523119 [Xylariaceae sp. AK1471]|nr:hypothetical protein HD806DRAFT_523119 [Xylariaceae sp. AK1471]